MAESPPRTPLSHRRMAPPLQLQFSDDDNDENKLNFANTPSNSNQNKSFTCQSDIVVGNQEMSMIQHAQSFDTVDDNASEVSVARLKGWLDDFGKQNHAHYVKNNPNVPTDDGSSIQGSHSIDSDCESDLSVSRLKGWLDDFGKQNRAHYDKVNHIGKVPDGVSLAKPIRSKSANTPASKPVVTRTVRRNTDPSVMNAETKKGPAKTPVRYKSRFKKDEVQATNNGYASVKKIAAWLADDPTADKKMTTVRKGINVINKSRLFEKDLENVIIEENRIIKGSVSNKKDFFQSEAFIDDEGKQETASCVSVSDKKKWLEGAFGNKSAQDEQVEDDDDDSIVSMSVLDKKQWLQNAFKSTNDGRDKSTAITPSRFKSAASAPGGSSMTPRRNEAAVMSVKQKFQNRAASRRSLSDTSDSLEIVSSHSEEETAAAKQKWQQRAARRSMTGSTDPPPKHAPTKSAELPKSPVKDASVNVTSEVPASTLPEPCEPPAIQRLKTVASIESPARNNVARKWQERKANKERTSPQRPGLERKNSGLTSSPARANIAKKWQERKAAKQMADIQGSSKSTDEKITTTTSASGGAIEPKPDEEEAFDFRAAREKLVKRSAQNGNPVKVINKVQLRKQKFEKIQADMRKQSAPMGMLKPTWEQAAPEVGPTTSYTKNFVDNIAPKKSFEELP